LEDDVFMTRKERAKECAGVKAPKEMKPGTPPEPTPSALHLRMAKVRSLKPVQVQGAPPLPSSLVIPPGRYQVHGQTYSLEKEGLCRFLLPTRENQQRIVFKNDVPALISALCWMVSHGYRDNDKGYAELVRSAKRGKLILTCHAVCVFAKELLTRHGIEARIVNGMTLCESNGYNDGHVLLEVLSGKAWTLWDIDMHSAFRKGNRRLSLIDVLPLIGRGDYQLEPLALSIPLAVGWFERGGYAYDLWMETLLCSEKAQRSFYQRVLMAAGIEGHWLSASESSRRSLVLRKPGVLGRQEFLTKLYKTYETNC
jgi:hypothetical protein